MEVNKNYKEVCSILKKSIIEHANYEIVNEREHEKDKYFLLSEKKQIKYLNKEIEKRQKNLPLYSFKKLNSCFDKDKLLVDEVIDFNFIWYKPELLKEIEKLNLKSNIEKKINTYFETVPFTKTPLGTIYDKIIVEISFLKRLEFLINERKRLLKIEDVLIDYSDSAAKQKLIALNELGIIKFLKDIEPFNENISKMSEALSLITGIKADNLRSSITPMIQENNIQRNNPYNNKNNVSEVVKKLIEIKK